MLPAAGIDVPAEMQLPERLVEVQRLMEKGDARAAKIYETIGVYLGYTIALYREFYEFEHMLVLGRVTTGSLHVNPTQLACQRLSRLFLAGNHGRDLAAR